MCRKFRLIQNIENTTIEELCAYLKRLFKIYGIFVIINIVNLATDIKSKNTAGGAFVVADIVLYLINMGFLYSTAQNPTVCGSNLNIVGLALLSALNIAYLIFTVLTGSLWALTSLIGVILQWSTIYLIYKLREKIINRNLPSSAGGLYPSATNPTAPEVPTAYAEPIMSPVSQGYNPKAADKV